MTYATNVVDSNKAYATWILLTRTMLSRRENDTKQTPVKTQTTAHRLFWFLWSQVNTNKTGTDSHAHTRNRYCDNILRIWDEDDWLWLGRLISRVNTGSLIMYAVNYVSGRIRSQRAYTCTRLYTTPSADGRQRQPNVRVSCMSVFMNVITDLIII